jgi:hypothetical protein
MAPGLLNAHRWLVAIYRRNREDFTKVAYHQRAIADLQEKRARAGTA